MAKQNGKALSLKNITKSSVWDLQENDVVRMLQGAEKDAELKENLTHYTDIIKTAFDLEEIKIDRPEVVKKYEARGMKVGVLQNSEGEKRKIAVKKRPITRVTDLTYENIRHISAAKLIDVLDKNFGGGWDSLSQSIKDIIESGFDISTTTLPATRMHKAGSMYDKKVKDGFEVLEIQRGAWSEAIFAKAKPMTEKPKYRSEMSDDDFDLLDDEEDNDHIDMTDDDDDELTDEQLTEESYITTFEDAPEDVTLDDATADEEDDY